MKKTHTIRVRKSSDKYSEIYFVEAFQGDKKISASTPTISRSKSVFVTERWGEWEISWGSSSDKSWETKSAEADCIAWGMKMLEALLDGRNVSDTGSIE